MGSWRSVSRDAKVLLRKASKGKVNIEDVDQRKLRPLTRLGYISITKSGIVTVKKAGHDFLAAKRR